MRLIVPTINHLRALMRWFPDESAVRMWGGPTFRFPFDQQTFLEDLQWGDRPTYILEDADGAMAAFGQLYVREGRAHLARLAVDPQRRGQGMGLGLVNALIAKGRELFPQAANSLFVLSGNERALRCYRKAGFVQEALPPDQAPYAGLIFMVRPFS